MPLSAAMLYHAGTLDNDFAPTRGRRHRRTHDLAVYLLTPGFTTAYHGHVLGVSRTTINKHLAWSRALAAQDPTVFEDVERNVTSITPADGINMAQRRGTTHLPWWSRLAIADYSARMRSTSEVAALFRCSQRTVQQVRRCGCLAYDLFTGARRPSSTQLSPPGKWKKPDK